MGNYTAHGYLYKPSYGETGRDTTSKFNGGLDLVDAYMAGTAFSAPDFGTYTLAEIVAAIGSDPATIYFPSSTVNINANTTVPANIVCIIPNGGILHVATDVTLTVNGYIEAGPYQIFSWTGTGAIDLSSNNLIRDVPLEWFGAEAGIGNDISAALSKINDSVGINQTIYVNNGLWRIASSVDLTKTWAPVRLKGHSLWSSQIYVDVGSGNIGLTFYGDTAHIGAASSQYLSIEDISFIGPTSCCTNAIKAQEVHDVYLNNCNFWLGNTGYACWLSGCINIHGYILVRRPTNNFGSYSTPENGILIDSSATPYQSNATDLRVWIGATNGTGLYFDGTNFAPGILKLSGIIETCDDYLLRMYNVTEFTLTDLYLENSPGHTGDVLLNKCRQGTINNILFNSENSNFRFEQCRDIDMSNHYMVGTCKIRADCRNFTIGVGQVYSNPWEDDAPDTIYRGRVSASWGGYPYIKAVPAKTPDKTNLVYNASLSRWTATNPDFFTCSATGTYTVETSIVHNAANSTKVVTQGASSYDTITITADARQLTQIKGKVITVSWMVYAPAQADLTANAAFVIADNPTAPARGDNTAYLVNDAVIASGALWTCIVAGTSGGSAPTWTSTDGDLVTDGGVTWVRSSYGGVNDFAYYHATDAGKWKKLSTVVFVPNNNTAWSATLYLYDLTTGAAATYYVAEPTITIGALGTTGFVPSQNEMLGFQQVGANKTSWGTAVPSSGWCQRGDIVWRTDATAGQSPGWICTTSGVGGSGAVWKAFANVGA